jgi:hypothetical protein
MSNAPSVRIPWAKAHLAAALMVVGGGLWAGDAPVLLGVANTLDQNCKNKSGPSCPPCQTCSTPGPSSSSAASAIGSYIDQSAWSHYHKAMDYRVALPGQQGPRDARHAAAPPRRCPAA